MDYPGKVITKNQVTPSQTSASGVWTVDDAAAAVENNSWPVAGVPNPISRSLRFNSADSAYLNRTPATAGTSATIWTFSWWQKGVALTGLTQVVLGAENGGNRDLIRWDGSGTLEFVKSSSTSIRVPTAKYRDPSAWYHFVINVSGATVGVYVNGVQVTAFATSNNPSGNWFINQNNLHRIGFDPTGGDALNGYLTEIHMIDGQALTPASFGMTDPRTGAWISKPYNGTYGTNGFYLNFSNNASTAALGTDYSGNSNTWTTNNFSVTAGAGNDSLTDVPTPWIAYNTTGDVGGVVRGNYCTLNPLDNGGHTLSNGNLKMVGASAYDTTRSTVGMSSGKWYAEATITIGTSGGTSIGIATAQAPLNNYLEFSAYGWVYNQSNGNKGNNNSYSAYGASYTTNDVIGIAFDADAGTLTFYKNGVSQGTAYSSLTSGPYFFAGTTYYSNNAFDWNFGQRPFAYTPPAGFLSLCTTNLPTPTILDGGDYFNTVTYTGTGATNNAVTGVGFQPDFVWVKNRSSALSHVLQDAVRPSYAYLFSDRTDSENTNSQYDWFKSFDSDGFTVSTSSTAGVSTSEWNGSGNAMVAWNWKAGGTPAVTNTDGTITSSISVNTTSGFSIVTYTGTGANATVGHGLGAAPAMVIIKERDGTGFWVVGHTSLGWSYYTRLNATLAVEGPTAVAWNNTAPTSTVVSLGTSNILNNSGSDLVMYAFAPISGFSAFGSYTGNGNADGPFVYTGFRVAYVMIKGSSFSSNWRIADSARNTYNVASANLEANLTDAEGATSNTVDFLSNGFKIRGTGNDLNTSSGTIIYAAFAENPFKYSNAR